MAKSIMLQVEEVYERRADRNEVMRKEKNMRLVVEPIDENAQLRRASARAGECKLNRAKAKRRSTHG